MIICGRERREERGWKALRSFLLCKYLVNGKQERRLSVRSSVVAKAVKALKALKALTSTQRERVGLTEQRDRAAMLCPSW